MLDTLRRNDLTGVLHHPQLEAYAELVGKIDAINRALIQDRRAFLQESFGTPTGMVTVETAEIRAAEPERIAGEAAQLMPLAAAPPTAVGGAAASGMSCAASPAIRSGSAALISAVSTVTIPVGVPKLS